MLQWLTLPQPAQARSGAACASAIQQAWIMSCAGSTVHMVTGAGDLGLTMEPSGALMVTQR